jgi:hypothetical protein
MFIYLFSIYIRTLSAPQTIQHWIQVRRWWNGRTGKVAVAAQFEVSGNSLKGLRIPRTPSIRIPSLRAEILPPERGAKLIPVQQQILVYRKVGFMRTVTYRCCKNTISNYMLAKLQYLYWVLKLFVYFLPPSLH